MTKRRKGRGPKRTQVRRQRYKSRRKIADRSIALSFKNFDCMITQGTGSHNAGMFVLLVFDKSKTLDKPVAAFDHHILTKIRDDGDRTGKHVLSVMPREFIYYWLLAHGYLKNK